MMVHYVGIAAFPLEMSEANPSWKWTDEQFEFQAKFERACKGYYMTIPLRALFHDDNSVTLGFRKRFSMGDAPPTKTFSNWRKLKSIEMKEFYNESNNYKKSDIL